MSKAISESKIKRIYDGVEAEARKSQASFQIIQVSSEVCMGRVCYGPSLSWAEFVMGRVVQLPNFVYALTLQKYSINILFCA